MNTPPRKVIIVAEFTCNHLGDRERLKAMVWLSKKAGADLIKIQKRNVDTFYPPEQLNAPYASTFGTTLGDYRKGVELSLEDISVLEEECKKADIGWFVSVLDYESFLSLERLKSPLLKIPSTISEHRLFHKKVADRYKGPIVVSTGFTSHEYEDYVQEVFKDNERIYLLQTTSTYPTPPEESSIAVVRHYRDLSKKNPKIIPGYSSHDHGSLGSMLAVAAGALMIEKHVKLGKSPWVHFDQVALDLSGDDFSKFVQDIRIAEKMLGDEKKTIKPSEHHKYTHIPKID